MQLKIWLYCYTRHTLQCGTLHSVQWGHLMHILSAETSSGSTKVLFKFLWCLILTIHFLQVILFDTCVILLHPNGVDVWNIPPLHMCSQPSEIVQLRDLTFSKTLPDEDQNPSICLSHSSYLTPDFVMGIPRPWITKSNTASYFGVLVAGSDEPSPPLT